MTQSNTLIGRKGVRDRRREEARERRGGGRGGGKEGGREGVSGGRDGAGFRFEAGFFEPVQVILDCCCHWQQRHVSP